MSMITLSAYKFQLTHYNKDSEMTEYYLVNDISGKSFFDIISEFCSTYKDYESDESEKKVFKSSIIDSFKEYDNGDSKLNYSAIMGRTNTGEWGYTRDIVDPDSGDVVYTKPADLADVLPFLFSVAMPYEEESANKAIAGIIMFQNLGVYGMKTAFLKHLRQYLSDNYPDVTLEIYPLCPLTFARHIMDKGILKEVSIVKNIIPADTANGIGLCTTNGYQELTFKGIDGLTKNKKQELSNFILSGNGNIHEILQLPDVNFDNVKYKFKIGHRTVTLNLNNLDRLNVSEEVLNTAVGKDGHPIPEKLKVYFGQMYKDYAPYIDLCLKGD